MALRPKAFSIPSTTELKITFTANLSENLTVNNFQVESLNGAVNDLDVLGFTIDGNIVTLKTRPQVSGNYYLLKLLDTNETIFLSERGERLIDDAVSRELFFVGIDSINPIRDRIFEKMPGLITLENSTTKDIISAQAEELYAAQKSIGELLSDNYISIEVVDEFKVRTAGATDRMANENAYEVTRVSKNVTNSQPKANRLVYTSDNVYSRLQSIPYYPISLQQVLVEDEEISLSSTNNSFDGYLVNVTKNNIIKLLTLKLIKSDDIEDCDGNIGTEYNIERYKYTLANNFYDQAYSFKYSNLNNNQILLSEFGNISRPEPGDTIILSYLYQDLGRVVLRDTVTLTTVEPISNESVPSNATNFFLNHAPIVNSENESITKGGLTFKTSENDSTVPEQFKKELPFNISKLPSLPGEYSVNYQTGEVFLIGEERQGTGRNNFVVGYYYQKSYRDVLDYSISGNDLVANPDRNLVGNEAEIFLNYETVYVPGTDYDISSHIEVLGEQVENRLTQSFALSTEYSPITNVYRILNQTTGEVYNPLYNTATEIFFSGNRSPEIKTSINEKATFKKIDNEELTVISELIAPIFEVRVTTNISNNSIQFSPKIPAEFISLNSTDYFLREKFSGSEPVDISDLNIRFFGTPDSNNLISSLAISSTATPPTLNSENLIGTRVYVIALDEIGVLNNNLDAIGSFCNTSINFSDNDIFANEKFFEPVDITPDFIETTSSTLSVTLDFDRTNILHKNLSRLRQVGDYSVDYKHGLIYVAISSDQDLQLGTVSYNCQKHVTRSQNIFTVLSAAKKKNLPDSLTDAQIIYKSLDNENDSISILDLEDTFISFDNETKAPDLDNNLQLVAEVLEDYTVVVPFEIKNIKTINNYTDVTGSNFTSSLEADRILEKDIADLLTPITSGGYNLVDGVTTSFSKNVIDLKKKVRRRAYANVDGTKELQINDQYADIFYEVKRVATGDVVYFDQELNITKVSGVRVVEATLDSPSAIVSIIVSDIEELDTDNDYLLDSDGNRFLITDIDTDLSVITVDSPAENNALATVPNLDPEGEASSIIVKPTVTIVDGVMTITIPEDGGTSSGELLEVIYLTSFIPSIGTPLFIDYKYGEVYLDYNYVYDQIAIWYEYGDNSLDWSISNTLSEGDEYFVTYKYGANRSALRRNFGTLTQIPFFQQFPLDTNRELYRNGLKGTLQAFPKGPTIPAYEELIKSFTDINPNIEEINFGSWVLGRDYTNPNSIEVSGDLNFKNGKFEAGLLIDEQTVISIPSISSLPINEGSLEFWMQPNWSGINNDATLTFYLENIGPEKFILLSNANPFTLENKFIIAPVEDIGGIIDSKGNGVRISNFKSVEDPSKDFEVLDSGIFREFSNLNKITSINFESKVKINDFGIHINRLSADLSLQDNFSVGQILITDSNLLNGISFELSAALDEDGVITFTTASDDLDYTTIPNYIRPHKTRSCACTIINNVSTLQSFNTLTIEITLDEAIDFTVLKGLVDITEDTPGALVLMDSLGDIYQVTGLVDDTDTTYENHIPDIISKIIVARFPINNSNIKQALVDDINDTLPIGLLTLFYKNIKIIGNGKSKNETVFAHTSEFLLDWNTYKNIKLDRDPVTNLFKVRIDDTEYSSFYTDGISISDYNLVNFTSSSSENSGIYFGSFDNTILSTFELFNLNGTYYNRFNIDDIYIGKTAYHPNRIPFSVNRVYDNKSVVGLPNNINDDEGIFIAFDDLCTSPLSENIGQWVFSTKAERILDVSVGVEVLGLNSYNIVTDSEAVTHTFSGYILTDGEFSSVVKSSRDEVSGQCAVGVVCDNSFRFCGNELLEDFGWRKLEEADSDYINTIVGGRETQIGSWRKDGEFNTSSSSGIYQMGPSTDTESDYGNALLTVLPCTGGQIEYITSFQVVDHDPSIISTSIGRFTGAITGNLLGIVPIHIVDTVINYKVGLALDEFGQGLITVIDDSNKNFLDIIRYGWNDEAFHELRVLVDYTLSQVKLYIDDLIISIVSINDFSTNVNTFSQNTIGLYLFDSSLVDQEEFHNSLNGNIVNIDLIFFSGFYEDGDSVLESTDVFVNTDNRIDFEFNIDILDGYFDSYTVFNGVGYDSYTEEQDVIAVDELLISSDKLRYLVDTGVSAAEQRFSIFKDGKGYLNFRIFDKKLRKNFETGIYNISTSILQFIAGEQHHVGVSWKLNSINEEDEMHLFIDGQEVPNLYRFGGVVPVRINERFADVSKEVLQSFLVRNIVYPDHILDGTVNASLALFTSNTLSFTEAMIGRSLIIHNSVLAPTLIGKEFVIKAVTAGSAILGRGLDLSTIEFDVSTSDIEFSFAPYIDSVYTDLRNSRFIIFKTDASEEETEFSGILYQITNNEIDIISGANSINPQYRVNVDTRLIEFIGQNSDCEFVNTVTETDIDVHIETFGLNLELCREKFSLLNSSYFVDDLKYGGQSVLHLHSREPVALEDVRVKRIILDTTAVEIVSPVPYSNGYLATFEIELEENISKLSSEEGLVYKQNLGRLLSVIIDSDNIDFCEFDGYEDAYQDGYLNGTVNTVTVYGTTTDGTDNETFFIDKNGPIDGTKFFTSVTRIDGNIKIIDPDYFELGTISLEEKDTLDVSNNNGEEMEVFDYQSGNFILTVVGSNGTYPFELPAGFYRIEYPTHLSIRIDQFGDKLYLGTDFNEENFFDGVMDEFRIISESSSDTRVTETETLGTRSITDDYYRSIEFCPTEQTLALIHFNDPKQLQVRRLRNIEFLDQVNNFKYKLNNSELESLYESLNNQEDFVKKMLNFGFSIEQANLTYIEAHFAEGGPIWNEADFYKNYVDYIISNKSVNDSFDNSAYFYKGQNLFYDNSNGLFRKEEGTIEFWVSPIVDTAIDEDFRYYLDIYSARRISITSLSSNTIELPNPATKILSINLLTKTQKDSQLYSSNDAERIIFDEISRNNISGMLSGGTGVLKDFSIGSQLSSDGNRIFLAETLPGHNVDVVVSYMPLGIQGDRVSIFKNQYSQVVFSITADGVDNVVSADVNWKKNTWHRIKCTYKTNSNGDDFIKIFVDGRDGGYIRYGTGLIYGTGYVYGQYTYEEGTARTIDYKIPLRDNLRLISIGSDIFGDQTARSRMDNIRFSRVIRNDVRDATGRFLDINYSENLETISPVVSDDATTLLLDFDESSQKVDKFATVIDPENGIFDFNVEVIDNFDKIIGINNGKIEDLIVSLVNKLKPAHTNAYVKFKKSTC